MLRVACFTLWDGRNVSFRTDRVRLIRKCDKGGTILFFEAGDVIKAADEFDAAATTFPLMLYATLQGGTAIGIPVDQITALRETSDGETIIKCRNLDQWPVVESTKDLTQHWLNLLAEIDQYQFLDLPLPNKVPRYDGEKESGTA